MANRLSHSAVTHFARCPQSYKYHYIERLRHVNQSAALLMGSAIDKATEFLMQNPTGDAVSVFLKHWNFAEINNVETYLPEATNIVYAESDFDDDLLSPEDWTKIQTVIESAYEDSPQESPQTFVSKIYGIKGNVGFDNLSQQMKKILNYANWLSLRAKGILMLKAVERDFLPNITKIHSTQEKIELTNEEDSIIGYVDLVASWKGYDKPIILDVKTSARKYDEKNSVIMSPQLSLYLHSLTEKYDNTRYAGYLVINKNIKKNRVKICSVCRYDGSGARHKTCSNEIEGKRCGGEWKETMNCEATTQVIIDKIPEQTENIVMENMGLINESIKNGVFHRNLNACLQPFPCTFVEKCYRDSNKDLIVVENKK